MRYVHASQADMDRAMEWYSNMQTPGPGLEKMLLEYKDTNERGGWPGPVFAPTSPEKLARLGPFAANWQNRRTS
jgi:hypothetical protein